MAVTGTPVVRRADHLPPPGWRRYAEAMSLGARLWRGIGQVGPRGPGDGAKVLVIPGFLATDRTTLGLQRALARVGFRVSGWGLGFSRGARSDTLDRLTARLEAFAAGTPVLLVGWSLGGVYAREIAHMRPDLVSGVVTLGSPFSGDPRANNVWRLYEGIAGHPVDRPPIARHPDPKPPVPTLALWSRRDGIVAPAAARGLPHERDAAVELDCTHMGFATSGKAFPHVIAAIRRWQETASTPRVERE